MEKIKNTMPRLAIAGDSTPRLISAINFCKPVLLGSIDGISEIGSMVHAGACVVVYCSPVAKSRPYSWYMSNVFFPSARRVHRGYQLPSRKTDIAFILSRLPFLKTNSTPKDASLRQETIDRAWREMTRDMKWISKGPPSTFSDVVLVGCHGSWECIVPNETLPVSLSIQELLGTVRRLCPDPSLGTLTIQDLSRMHDAHSLRLLLTRQELQQHADVNHMAPCEATMQSMYGAAECIEKYLTGMSDVDCARELGKTFPAVRYFVFVPLGMVPLPRCGMPLFPGIWNNIPELTDALLRRVLENPAIREASIILPSDLLNCPNIPSVSVYDVQLGSSFAYGQVANAFSGMPPADSFLMGGRRPKPTMPGQSKARSLLARTCGENPMAEIEQCVNLVAEQRASWMIGQKSRPPFWLGSGCGEPTGPFTVAPFDRYYYAKPQPAQSMTVAEASCPINLAFVRAKYCSSLASLLNVPMLSKLKAVLGYAISHGLVDPWAFVNFQNANDVGLSQGTQQLLCGILRNSNAAMVLYVLDGSIAGRKFSQTLHQTFVGPEVVPSVACSSEGNVETMKAAPLPELFTDTKEDEVVNTDGLSAHAYNVDAWHVPYLSPLTEGAGENPCPASFQPVNPAMWFNFSTSGGLAETMPMMCASGVSAEDTLFSLLPHPSYMDSTEVSLFFAGTRYSTFMDSFDDIRNVCGRLVAMCAPTPSAADVLAIVTNRSPILTQRAAFLYHVLHQIRTLKDSIDLMNTKLREAEGRWEAYFAGQIPEPPMDRHVWESLVSKTPMEALNLLAKLETEFNAVPEPVQEYVTVYGRFDPEQLRIEYPEKALRPCPFTQRAVGLLRDDLKMNVRVVEVVDYLDPKVPVGKPVDHTTVPIIFHHDTMGKEHFIGGFTDAQEWAKLRSP